MNEITPYTAPAGVSLVDIRSDAKTYPRIKHLAAQQATARLQQVVAMAYAYTGRPAEGNRIEVVAAALYNELMEDKRGLGTANITIEEIGHAVKTAILDGEDDMYISVASLYKAVCNYAAGEGNDAQKAAYQRIVDQRKAQLAASPVGAMLETYAGRMLGNAKSNL